MTSRIWFGEAGATPPLKVKSPWGLRALVIPEGVLLRGSVSRVPYVVQTRVVPVGVTPPGDSTIRARKFGSSKVRRLQESYFDVEQLGFELPMDDFRWLPIGTALRANEEEFEITAISKNPEAAITAKSRLDPSRRMTWAKNLLCAWRSKRRKFDPDLKSISLPTFSPEEGVDLSEAWRVQHNILLEIAAEREAPPLTMAAKVTATADNSPDPFQEW